MQLCKAETYHPANSKLGVQMHSAVSSLWSSQRFGRAFASFLQPWQATPWQMRALVRENCASIAIFSLPWPLVRDLSGGKNLLHSDIVAIFEPKELWIFPAYWHLWQWNTLIDNKVEKICIGFRKWRKTKSHSDILTRPLYMFYTFCFRYKILFLDVLFPLDVKKIIFVDADQVCSMLLMLKKTEFIVCLLIFYEEMIWQKDQSSAIGFKDEWQLILF